jgi:hypothetical protein
VEEHAMEAAIPCCKEIQDGTIEMQADAGHLGFSSAYSRDLPDK